MNEFIEGQIMKYNWNRYAMLFRIKSPTELDVIERNMRVQFQNRYSNLFNGDVCRNRVELDTILNLIQSTLSPSLKASVDRWMKK